MLPFGAGVTPNNDRGRDTAARQTICRKRLYDPAAGAYLTLDDLALLAEDDEDFAVTEAETGEDITGSVLKQIIVERRRHG